MANGNFGGGNGTLETPYIVQDGADFNAIRNNLGAAYRQDRDIDLSAYTDWVPIGTSASSFSGVYDGGGFKIQNLNITTSKRGNGLFGYFIGQILGVNVVGGSIVGSDYCSTLGYDSSSNVVKNCSSQGLLLTFSGSSAGLIYKDYGSVEDCFNTSNVALINSASSFAGVTTTDAIRCYNTGNITINSSGSFSGVTIRIATDCYNTGNMNCIGANSHSVVFHGVTSSRATRCYNSGHLDASYVQPTGVVSSRVIYGICNSIATDCYNVGDLTIDSANVITATSPPSTIAGITGNTATNCYNLGVITGYGLCYGISSYIAKNCFFLAPKMKRSLGSNHLTFYAITNNTTTSNTGNYVLQGSYLEL